MVEVACLAITGRTTLIWPLYWGLDYIGLAGRDIVKDGCVGLSVGVVSPVVAANPETRFFSSDSIDVNVSRHHFVEWEHLLGSVLSRPCILTGADFKITVWSGNAPALDT